MTTPSIQPIHNLMVIWFSFSEFYKAGKRSNIELKKGGYPLVSPIETDERIFLVHSYIEYFTSFFSLTNKLNIMSTKYIYTKKMATIRHDPRLGFPWFAFIVVYGRDGKSKRNKKIKKNSNVKNLYNLIIFHIRNLLTLMTNFTNFARLFRWHGIWFTLLKYLLVFYGQNLSTYYSYSSK